jgi:hypothetical protein
VVLKLVAVAVKPVISACRSSRGGPFHCCDPGRFAEDLGLGIGWLAELTMSGAWSQRPVTGIEDETPPASGGGEAGPRQDIVAPPSDGEG